MFKTSKNVEAFCFYPFQRLKITPEGDATFCCFQHRKCLGNILNQSLEEIWFSEIAEEVRKDTLEGKLHPTCSISTCPFYLKDKEEVFNFVQKTYPSQFEIDLPMQHCNIGGENPTEKNPACIMCERHLYFNRQEDHLKEICDKLKPYVRHVDSVHIQGVAEPFWKERIFEIIEWLGIPDYKQKIRITTTTNGTLMNEKRRKEFLAFPLSTITWSLDAATAETFANIRRLKVYDRIIENLRAYAKERDPVHQFLHIHNNINLLNVHEVEGMVELAAEVGVNCLDFNATYSVPDICVNEDNVHIFKEAQLKILRKARELGVYVTFMRNLVLDFDDPPVFVPPKPKMPHEFLAKTTFVELELPHHD